MRQEPAGGDGRTQLARKDEAEAGRQWGGTRPGSVTAASSPAAVADDGSSEIVLSDGVQDATRGTREGWQPQPRDAEGLLALARDLPTL